jgi:hypothetical protein
MITADRRTYLGIICDLVDRMKPGECLRVDVREMRLEIPSYEHNSATFTPADRVLGNIVGSAYTHSYTLDPMGDTVTFRRHEDTGQRRFIDPDRRLQRPHPDDHRQDDRARDEPDAE